MSEELFKNLGNYLKEHRTACSLSQGEVAKKLGYGSPQFISNIERGLCAPPLKKLKLLIKLYSLKSEEVIGLILREQEKNLRKTLLVANKSITINNKPLTLKKKSATSKSLN